MIVVFAGPSLTAEDKAACPGITFRAPAEQGDILIAARAGATAIGLIDGYFGDRLAPHQKEILEVLSMGIPVLGSASMGAMRAAELHLYGMTGIGSIYEGYASGEIECDAEVAVSHGPEELGFPATSVSMVDVRATVEALSQSGQLSGEAARQIIAAALDLHFSKRTYPAIAASLQDDGPLAALLQDNRVEQKRQEAVQLLSAITAEGLAAPQTPAPPMTRYYGDIRSRAITRAG